MQELPPLRSGQRVDVRGEAWLVVNAERFDEVTLVTLRGVGHDNLGETRRVLAPFDRVQQVAPRSGLARASRRRVLTAAAAAIAESPRWLDCWTAGTARIDLRAWQLEPALAVLRGATRILLADEVGLGKTIQALLIVSELTARCLAERVLVLTPASLRDQWAAEISDKFGMTATVFDQSSLAATTAALPLGVNPWNTAPLIVSSIDLVKRPEVRAALDGVSLDVLVVDEAHHLSPGSDRGAVVADLAARTPWVVLVTATPHSGDEAAYRFLRSLGDLDARDDLVTYRRAARHVHASIPRRVRLLGVEPTAAERALLDGTLAYARELWQGAPTNPGVRLVAAVIARRAASSAVAARWTLERRLSLMRGEIPDPQQTHLPWDEGNNADTGEPDTVLSLPGLPSYTNEVAWLEHLIALARATTASSKVAVIRRLLRRTAEHLILFSEYRDVVISVGSQIDDLATVDVLHGGLTASARRDVIRAFVEGGARVLVTTDAAGEGLNLQTHCRLVVNLELPWNPVRLEQRVGRVDRLGQTRRVHALHLFHRGSFEEAVLAHLERRRALAFTELGAHDTLLSELTIAAAVLGAAPANLAGTMSSTSRAMAPTKSTLSSATERRLRALVRGRDDDMRQARPLYTCDEPPRAAAAWVVLLFVADLVDGSGRLFQRELIPLGAPSRMPERTRRGLSRNLVERFANAPATRQLLDDEIERRLATACEDASALPAALEQRVAEIVGALRRRSAHKPFQGSLFDRRAEQQSHTRASVINAWAEHVAHRAGAARALRFLRVASPRLVAAWLAE